MYIVLGIAIVLSVLFMPSAAIVRPEYAFALCGAVAVVATAPATFPKAVRGEVLLLVVLAVLAIVTLLWQQTNGGSVVRRDAMIVARYIIYCAYLVVGVAIGTRCARGRPLDNFVAALVVVIVIVTIAQYFNVAGFAERMIRLYGRVEDFERLYAVSRRAYGTLGNPNYWGLICGGCLLFSAYKVFFAHQRRWVVGVVLMLACIVLTGSRTAVIAPLLAWVLFSLLIYRAVRFKRLLIVLPLSVAAGIMAVVWLLDSGLYEFSERFTVEQAGTWGLRVAYWESLQAQIFSSFATFLVGSGPNKLTTITWTDNMYVLLLRDFGFLGLLGFVCFMVYVVAKLRQMFLAGVGVRDVVGPALLLWLLLLAYNITADAWFAARPVTFVLLMHGIACGASLRLAHGESKARARRGPAGLVPA